MCVYYLCYSTDAGLSLVLFDLSQEELLNRLMVFGSAGTVDSLCHLNAWGRCSIPVHALQVITDTRVIINGISNDQYIFKNKCFAKI